MEISDPTGRSYFCAILLMRRRHGDQRAGLVDGMAPAAESRVPNLRDGGEDDAHMTRLPL